MNIRLFKAKLHRWIFRSERISRGARDCDRCCLACRKYFVCTGTDATIVDLWAHANAGHISNELAEQCAEEMEKVLGQMKD